jgi:hypothetical protein
MIEILLKVALNTITLPLYADTVTLLGLNEEVLTFMTGFYNLFVNLSGKFYELILTLSE